MDSGLYFRCYEGGRDAITGFRHAQAPLVKGDENELSRVAATTGVYFASNTAHRFGFDKGNSARLQHSGNQLSLECFRPGRTAERRTAESTEGSYELQIPASWNQATSRGLCPELCPDRNHRVGTDGFFLAALVRAGQICETAKTAGRKIRSHPGRETRHQQRADEFLLA